MNAAAKNPLKSCLPPDPDPTQPTLVLPPGACDAHCHVFGPAAKFPSSADRSSTPPDAPVENLRRLHARLGIARAIIVHASCHGTDMDVTLDAIASSNGTYRGVACVEDSVTDRELARLRDGGIRGIRFNFVKHLGGVPDLEVFYRLVARIKPLGWHIVLHFDAEDILTQRELLGRIDVPFIIDHMGRVKAADGLEQKPFQSLLELYRSNPFGLGQSLRRRACFGGKAPVPRRRSVRAGAHRGRFEAHSLGHRLAASEYHQGHAQRRRVGRPVRRDLSGCGHKDAHPRG
jgi:2-pyrone-4,6-dicarboxylate lactonase